MPKNWRKITGAVQKNRGAAGCRKNVVFLTLGDPTVYSTYLYVHRWVLEDGYDARIVSGVTSFCAAAASLSEGLVENSEELHVIPASYQIEDALELSGTKVLMKAGKKMPAVKQFLKEKNCRAVMVENCGMDTEQKYFSAEEIPDQASYYSLIIVKEKRKNRWYILLERAPEPRI